MCLWFFTDLSIGYMIIAQTTRIVKSADRIDTSGQRGFFSIRAKERGYSDGVFRILSIVSTA